MSARAVPAPSPERRQELLAFLASLGLDAEEAARADAGGGPGLAAVEEALTHTSARRRWNHERLEFLGDAVLRLAAAEYLEERHAGLNVGRRSALRGQLVSDRWLAELGERCGLERVWRIGAIAAGDRAGQATLRAELCEALVGAVYELWGGAQGGLNAALRWLSPHWQRSSLELLAHPEQHNWKSALQEWSQPRGLGLPTYHCREVSAEHGDPRRFQCTVSLRLTDQAPPSCGEGWGASRRAAEQEAARALLKRISPAGEG
jgi:ribonuclease-3